MRLNYFSVSQVEEEEDVARHGQAHLDAGEVPGGDDVSKQDINLPIKCRLEA